MKQRLWKVTDRKGTVIKVRADDHNDAVRIASKRHMMVVTGCVLIDE